MRYDPTQFQVVSERAEVIHVKCFVAMPISTPDLWAEACNDTDHFAHVLNHLFIPALTAAGYEAVPPATVGAELIHAHIIRNLETCEMVLCDISTLNPNVFFELGIRTSLDRPTIIVKDTLTSKIPFDTGSINTFTYEAALHPWTLPRQVEALTEHIKEATATSDDRNSLWRYFGLTQRGAPAEISNPVEAKLDLLIDEVNRLKTRSITVRDLTAPGQNVSRAAFGRKYELELEAALTGLGYKTLNTGQASDGPYDLVIQDDRGRAIGADVKYISKPVSRQSFEQVASYASKSAMPIVLISPGGVSAQCAESPMSDQITAIQWSDQRDNGRLADELDRLFAAI